MYCAQTLERTGIRLVLAYVNSVQRQAKVYEAPIDTEDI